MLFMPPWPFLLQNSCSYQPDGTKISLIHHMGRWNGTVWAWFELKTLYIPSLTLKEPGFLDPSHSWGGGFRPPKISETDWRNIKCVILVDSYDPPESIGTKKSTNIPCMTPQWRHKWRHVKNTKITKNRQNHGFSLFFQAKVAFFWQWCVSKYAYTCSYSK